MATNIHPLLATVDQTPDPIDTLDLSGIEFSPNENPLDLSFKAGAEKNPDQTAEIIKTARSLNQPPAVVEKNLESAKVAASRPSSDYFKDIIEKNPRVAKFLSDPVNMAVAKDDIDNLKFFEETVKTSVRSLNPMNLPLLRPEDANRIAGDIGQGW